MGVKRLIGLTAFYLFAENLKDRFVAGHTPEDAVNKAEFFKKQGERSAINILGEHLRDPAKVDLVTLDYLILAYSLQQRGLFDAHISIKPSQLGIEISRDFYKENLGKVLNAAHIFLPESFVEIDRETHEYAKLVREVSLELANDFPNQRLACQINLLETREEIAEFIKAGISTRICKGNAYPGDINGEKDLRRIFLETAPLVIAKGKRPAFATHDLFLIDFISREFLKEKDKFELELLMGIEGGLHKEPHLREFIFRRYVPCGLNWRPYGKRRAEAVVNIILRNFWYKIARR